MSENDIDKIDPVDFEHNEEITLSNQTAEIKPDKPSLWAWVAVGGLFVVALLVIFVLPSIVSEYELPLERRVDVADLQTREAISAVPAISPFEESQRALQRKEAQDVLAVLLENQEQLNALDVTQWGQEPYAAALEQASLGDEYYRTQEFVSARDSYATSRDELFALIQTVPTVLTRTLIEAQQALDLADSATASDKFSLALLFEPENTIAQIGRRRAESLDEVGVLLREADDLLEDGELERARTIYQRVLALDSRNDSARQKMQETVDLIGENEFSAIMSSGYALLEEGKPERAIDAFLRASAMGINQEQAFAAIAQTENQIVNAEINDLKQLIEVAENDEEWQLAVGDYDKVLTTDPNLLFAIEGRDYAEKRARLDVLLINAIDNPGRFLEAAIFEQTLDIYYTGRAIENPGSRLSSQLDQLQVLLDSSQVPVDVQLISDDLTDVTLLRVGNLGTFEQTAVSLKPGRYVAVGKRAGYREVREEFTVGFGLTPEAVIVRCDESILPTQRRR